MEPVLKPLVYSRGARRSSRLTASAASPSTSSRRRCRRSSRSWPRELGFDGAIGSTCEIVDGVYTGVSLRACHGEGKAAAVRELAEREGLDLAASTAYSDSHTDLPFLEAVGHPVAVNPDRGLRRRPRERGWPVLEFSEPAVPGRRGGCGRRSSGSRSRSVPALPPGPSGAGDGLTRRSSRLRRSASAAPTPRRSSSTSTTPSGAASPGTATRGSSGWRRRRSTRPRGPQARRGHPGYELLGVAGRARLPRARRDLRRARGGRPWPARVVVGARVSDRRPRLLGAVARRGRLVAVADGDLAGAAAAPGGRRSRSSARTRSRSPSRAPTGGRSSPTSRWAPSPRAT